jgi:dihydrofolate synthase / folylpolyglutamate synthase
MNYRETLEYLYRLRLFGTKLGLKNIAQLTTVLGLPQDRLKFIHVAGTNGKGSVCAFLDSIYRQAGYKVGMFTSPHLVRFGERLQIQGRAIADDNLVDLVSRVRTSASKLPEDTSSTFFEFLTGMALQYFADEKCDIVIWETGMGGRLDATNIVTPECSVITNASLDHQAWLGNSIRKIAREKAGIIKAGKPIVTAETQAEAFGEIQLKSTQANSTLYQVSDDQFNNNTALGLKGTHQKSNAAIASKVVDLLNTDFPVSKANMLKGLQATTLPGRFQTLQWRKSKIILDVAHNLAGYEVLAANCRQEFGENKCELIFASLDDKPWKEGLKRLLPYCKSVHCVPAKSQRAVSPQNLIQYLESINPRRSRETKYLAHDHVETCLQNLKKSAQHPILITGSFYLIGEALSVIQDNDHNETSLNEWGAKL